MNTTDKEIHWDKHNDKDEVPLFEDWTLVERLARIVSSIQGVSPDYAFLASELASVLPLDIVGIVLLRHDKKAVRVTVCSRASTTSDERSAHWLVQAHQHPFVDSMFACIVEKPELCVRDYVDGLDGPPAYCGDALSGHHQLRSTCIVPLRNGEQVFGTLELASTTYGTYSREATKRLVSAIAQVLATAIERAQLGGNTRIQDRQRQALKDVSTALASKVDATVVLDRITYGISKALNVSSFLVTCNVQEQRQQLVAQAGLDAAQLAPLIQEEQRFDETIVGHAVHYCRPFLSDNIAIDERFPASRHLYTRLGIRSVLCSPLIVDNAVYGALLLCDTNAGGFTPLKVEIAALFANQAAIALRENMTLEVTNQRRRFQSAIEQLEREVQPPLSDEEELQLFTRVRAEVRQTFGVNLSSILKLIGNSLLTKNERLTASPPLEESKHEITEQVEMVLTRADMLSELSRLLVQWGQTVHTMRDAWFVVDLNGRCVYINPPAELLCGVRLIEMEPNGTTIEALFTSLFPRIRNVEEVRYYLHTIENAQRDDIRCVIAREPLSLRPLVSHYAQMDTLDTSTLLRHQDESALDSHYQLTRYLMHNLRGQRIAYALQVRDITTQVRDEANKAALLSSVSHHLRTPLTTIKASVTGLLQEDVAWPDEMRREMLEDIDTETDSLTVLIHALVEMSRIEMGALMLEKAWCSIEEIVHTALEKGKRAFTMPSVQVRVLATSPLVYVDYGQVERVVYNLVENAMRHRQAGTPTTVEIDVLEEKTQSTQVCVRLIHEGGHLPEPERERFLQSLDTMYSTDYGLHIAICKGIIEAHKGRLWIEQTPQGSLCVTFTLPLYI
jgi:signal transduction histidine kinase/GAF domain-containing protein